MHGIVCHKHLQIELIVSSGLWAINGKSTYPFRLHILVGGMIQSAPVIRPSADRVMVDKQTAALRIPQHRRRPYALGAAAQL
jgi:hypothetical protein